MADPAAYLVIALSGRALAVAGARAGCVVHALDLWEQGLAMDRRLEEIGADHMLVRLDGAPHGMESWEGHPEWAGYKTTLVSWLTGTLGPTRQAKRAR